VGLRRLLNRQTAAERPIEPLTWLAELGRAEDPHERSRATLTPTGVRQFRQPTRESDAAPARLVSVDEKVEPALDSVGRFSVANSKRAVVLPRSRSGYVWVSQASRSKRAGWADFTGQTF
jgi:hypothetical protein